MNAKELALGEIKALEEILSHVDTAQTDQLVREITQAKRIFIGGAGRSLLSMKGFAMRLMQTAHETFLVGEVCTPSVQPGDLLIVGSGSGKTPVTLEVVRKAKSHGARTAVITMHPDAPIPKECDRVVTLLETPPVSHEDSEALAFAKANLGGNFSEAAVTLAMDGVIGQLMKENGQTGETIMFYHANLE